MTAVIILVVVAAGAFVATQRSSNQDNADIPEDQQVIPVRRGDLIQEISITGSLSLPNRETLTFGSSGVIAEIMVEEGDKVTEGQTLAVLDQEDISALEEQAVEARVALRDAEEALEDYMSPSELDIARARKDVADAEASLQNARDALDDFLEPPSEVSISQIESRIAGYEVELDKIAEDIEDLREPPTQLRIDQARKNISTARVELERAEEALEDALAGPDPIDVESANNDIEAAKREFSNAEADLSLVSSDWEDRLDAAESEVEDKAEAYAEAFSRWLGVDVVANALDPDYEAALSDLGVDLEALFDLSARFSDLEEGGYYSDGLPQDDPTTAWSEPTIFLWLNLNPTDIQVLCEPDERTPYGSVCVQEEFRSTSKAYVKALDDLEDMRAQSVKGLSATQTAFERARNTLDKANDALEELTKPVEEAVIADMQVAVQLAETGLADAQEKLEELLEIEDVSLTVQNLEAQAELARANIRQANKDMEELMEDREETQRVALLEDIEVARLDVQEKRKDLQDLIERDPESLDLASLQVKVASAKVALSQAEERLAEATITAPFDGFVAQLEVEEGDEVERRTNIMVVVDTGVVELDGGVDEIDVLETQLGAVASVKVDALPDQEIVGAVSFIAAEPESGQGGGQSGVVSYPVEILLTVPDGVDLPAGLSAVASITISEELDVLLAPLDALRGRFDSPTLHVMKDGVIVETPVTLGSSDDFWTVVTSGVSEGDMIVARAPEGSEGEFDVTSGPDDGGGGDGPPRRRRQ